MARVVLENLSKNFAGPKGEEVCALKNVSLVVQDKEFLVLVGPSGCGKSTTLRLIAGLEEISRGTVSIDSQLVNDVPPKDRDVAMVFQNYALYPHMTVFENMAFGLKLRKFPKAEIHQRVRETAEILGLVPCLDRLPGALSGGQRQRVAVGRAMVRKPKVFLFDEPLSNLDAQMRVQMRTEISRLHARLGATMIYVTHDQVEAMTLGDRIAVMNEGVIQQVADPMHLYHHPANLFVAGFIGSPPMNIFQGALSPKGDSLWFVGQNSPGHSASGSFSVRVSEAHATRLTCCSGGQVVLGLRPESITLARLETESFVENRISATVEAVERMGSETCLHLTTDAHAFVARVAAGEKAEVGHNLLFSFDLSQAHFFDSTTELALI